MSLQNQLAEADLQKRSKDLDAREELIRQKEEILSETEANSKLEVLNKQIEAKQKMVDNYNQTIDSLHKKLILINQRLTTAEEDMAKIESSRQTQLTKLEAKHTGLELEIVELGKKREDIKKDIKVSRDYLSGQEVIVNEAIATWNGQLTGYQQEADEIEATKVKLLEDKIHLEQDCNTLKGSVAEIEGKLNTIATAYDARVDEYRSKLLELDNEVKGKVNQQSELDITNNLKNENLIAREKSVKIKEMALTKTEQELGRKERKLRGDYNRAGLEYS